MVRYAVQLKQQWLAEAPQAVGPHSLGTPEAKDSPHLCALDKLMKIFSICYTTRIREIVPDRSALAEIIPMGREFDGRYGFAEW